MRQKIFLTFVLLLMAVMGAWAKDFTGGELYTLEEFQYGNRVNLTENNICCHLRCDNRQRTTDSWYTLNGVKLDGEPTEAGVYICNGKKVVIK